LSRFFAVSHPGVAAVAGLVFLLADAAMQLPWPLISHVWNVYSGRYCTCWQLSTVALH